MTRAHDLNAVLGDVVEFYDRVVAHSRAVGIDPSDMVVSHVCYRVADDEDHAGTLASLRALAGAIAEYEFNGRPLALVEPAVKPAIGRQELDLIELPGPRAAHTYPTGLEHVGFVVPGDFDRFVESHHTVLSGFKDRGASFKPVFVTFGDGSTAKFYPRALRDEVEAQGRVFVQISDD